MTDQTELMIAFRMEKSGESLEAAKMLFREGKYTSTVNRIYYAVFYAASAVLLAKGFSSSKHSGVLSFFNKEFVNKGLVDKDSGHFYNRIFRHRNEGDYQDFVKFDGAEVEEWLGRAEKFVDEMRKLAAK